MTRPALPCPPATRLATKGGTSVVLPVPGGAWTTAVAAGPPLRSATARSSSDCAKVSPAPMASRSKGPRAGTGSGDTTGRVTPPLCPVPLPRPAATAPRLPHARKLARVPCRYAGAHGPDQTTHYRRPAGAGCAAAAPRPRGQRGCHGVRQRHHGEAARAGGRRRRRPAGTVRPRRGRGGHLGREAAEHLAGGRGRRRLTDLHAPADGQRHHPGPVPRLAPADPARRRAGLAGAARRRPSGYRRVTKPTTFSRLRGNDDVSSDRYSLCTFQNAP